MLRGKKIIIGITGSIAAFKIPAFIRLLVKEGAEVKVVMTPSAVDFVTPLTLSTLSGNPVLIEPFNPENGSWNSHVDLGRWADVFLIAPATANTLAKMATGIADNLLMAVYLSAKCPVFFAPAMDLDMFSHPTTVANIKKLEENGNMLIEPVTGELASGLVGAGRMEEPEKMLKVLQDHFSKKKSLLTDKKVLVTAGPTYEEIDPVRFIGNHSSGLMGFEIAEAFASEGAQVILVTGPTNLKLRSGSINRIDVVSAAEMDRECHKAAKSSDIIVMAAAVADFRPAQRAKNKIKKSPETLSIELVPTNDILASLGNNKKRGQLLVGFALETDNEKSNAMKKLKSKNLDFIVLNSLRDKNAGFKSITNRVTIIAADGKTTRYPLKEKAEVARDIVNVVISKVSRTII